MPDLATTEGTVKVLRWLVCVGQQVKRGEPLLEVETDKANMEVESFITGTVTELLAKPEDEIAVGAAIAVVEVPAEPSAIQGPTEQDTPGPQNNNDAGPDAKPSGQAGTGTQKGRGMFARNRDRDGSSGKKD